MDHHEDDERDDDEQEDLKKPTTHDQARNVEMKRVTAYVEDTEISSQNLNDAMKAVAAVKADAVERQQKEAALQRVRINKDDVELLEREFEISRTVAERKLREHAGDVHKAISDFLN